MFRRTAATRRPADASRGGQGQRLIRSADPRLASGATVRGETRRRLLRALITAGDRPASPRPGAALTHNQVVARIARSRLRWDLRRLSRAAHILRPWPAFLVGEARGGIRGYAIGAHRVVLRHRSRDIAVVNEIFGPDSPYEPPASLAARDLSGPLTIVDLGGNVGLFGVFAFARWQVASLLSFEPDPANASMLRRVRELNGWAGRWKVREQAVGNATGTTTFVGLGSPESRTASAGEAGVPVTVADLFSLSTPIDLLKIDIEGSEWEILGDARLAQLDARVVVIEWHSRSAPRPDEAHADARDALQSAGYRIHRDDRSGEAYGIGVIWASRTDAAIVAA